MMRERERVIEEAKTWIDTPYHHGAQVKGAGVDCGHLIAAAFEGSGLEPHVEIPRYPPHWYLFRNEEVVLDIIAARGGCEITFDEVNPADIVVYKFGRCFAHGGIVVQWPHIIHAFVQARRVMLEDANRNALLLNRERRFFTRKAWIT